MTTTEAPTVHSRPDVNNAILQAFGDIPAANIGDAQDRFGIAVGLHPVWRGARLVGRARTVWTRSGDNLYVHKSLEDARMGDVIVINGQGDLSRALIGDLIGLKARNAGIAGFVIDGAVRDADALAELGLPVFARSVTPAGPYKHGPGKLNVPVAIGGVVVCPNDLIVADADGVVVVAQDDIERVLNAAQEIERREAGKRAQFATAAASA